MFPSIVTRLEQLAVDDSDTLFFDHPLDHVPGMALFDALLRTARDAHAEATGDAEPARVRASLDFTKICESNLPTTLSCTPADARDGARGDGGGGWAVSALQDGYAVCTGTFAFVAGHASQPPGTAHARTTAVEPTTVAPRSVPVFALPAPAQLVHRSRPENILVAEISRPPIESLLLNPSPDHRLARTNPHFRSTTELLEATRQFVVMLAHTEGGAPMNTQMLWLSLTIDVPVRLPRHAPTLLRCLEHSGPGQRMVCTVLLAEADAGTELGMLNYVLRNVDPACYTKLRTR